ncbi:MAG TPA: hypothetical protein VLJ38_17510 [Polyangiaceae bacterium]|nr:hypothetical protein [Polyangiaceae bacterium]
MLPRSYYGFEACSERGVSMPTLYRGNHLVIQYQHASGYVRVVRTETPFESITDVAAALDACRAALADLDLALHGILFDWRRSPISTDPNLHKALAERMDALADAFDRRAILLATPVGTMQASRVGRAMGNQKMQVFNDEDAAVKYVTYP